jgi:hypothetical protein
MVKPRLSPTRTNRARVRFTTRASRELVTIIVDWVLRGWLTQYIIAMTLPEWKPLRKVNSIETLRRLTGYELA